MDITVIIVSWNVKDFLRRCLESIYRFARDIEFEVFVVDNNSSDGSGAMVKAEFPQVNLIANKENYGFSKANNQALIRSRGRYILFLNPDTELVDNSLKAMAGFMETHPDASAMGCRLIYPDGSLQSSCRHFPSFFTDLMENLWLEWIFPRNPFFNYYHMGSWRHDTVRSVDVPYGACLLVRRNTIEDVGLMDERFFMYYDEIDLCYRIKKRGGKIYFTPDIKVLHRLNRSSSQVPSETGRYKYRSKLLYFEKHYGRLAVVVLFANLCIQTALAPLFFMTRLLLTGRHGNAGYYREYFGLIWREYLNFLIKR